MAMHTYIQLYARSSTVSVCVLRGCADLPAYLRASHEGRHRSCGRLVAAFGRGHRARPRTACRSKRQAPLEPDRRPRRLERQRQRRLGGDHAALHARDRHQVALRGGPARRGVVAAAAQGGHEGRFGEGGAPRLPVRAAAEGAQARLVVHLAAAVVAAPHLRRERPQRLGGGLARDGVKVAQAVGRVVARVQLALHGRAHLVRLALPRQRARRQVGERVHEALDVVQGSHRPHAVVGRDAGEEHGADRPAGHGDVGPRARAKVDQVQRGRADGAGRAQEDVRRLDVVVHEARAVQLLEEADDVAADAEEGLPRQRRLVPAFPQVVDRGTEQVDHEEAAVCARLVVQQPGEAGNARHDLKHAGLAIDRVLLEAELDRHRPEPVGQLAHEKFALRALPNPLRDHHLVHGKLARIHGGVGVRPHTPPPVQEADAAVVP
mmetsp:Transcript_16684/g.28401  ORF Transcript_16684/g.28401 Transcript_16684/m.28401 type:complete len:435 (+) Transcript_16684:134-1438(+)